MSCYAKLHVSHLFNHKMVLQRELPVVVWGKATPGETVRVLFHGQETSAKAGEDGRWRLALPALKAEAKGKAFVVTSGDEKIVFRDVLVGEVWYASGQSNMQMILRQCAARLSEIKNVMEADRVYPIRFMQIADSDAEMPNEELIYRYDWREDRPGERKHVTAAGFFFARKLHEALGVPVGVIDGSWGGKPIEGFIPKPAYAKHELLKQILKLAEANDLEGLKQLKGGVIVRNTAGRPGRIYHSRVHPIVGSTIRGVIWYQGESNAGTGEDPRGYRHKMRALIEGWREAWGRDDLPFYYVQLPPFRDSVRGWIRLREEQRLSMGLPRTGMVVAIDLPDNDIHPANKLDVGNRLALLALGDTYGKDVAYRGPAFESASVKGQKMHVRFKHVGGGLMTGAKQGLGEVKGLDGAKVNYFELADEDGNWYAGEAKIIDKHVVEVVSEKVKRPVAVRYACMGAPQEANLYNRAGLPASPFCSDLNLLPWQR